MVSVTFRLTVEEIQINPLLKSYRTNVIPINLGNDIVLCTHVAYGQNLPEDLDDIIIPEAFNNVNILKIDQMQRLSSAILISSSGLY